MTPDMSLPEDLYPYEPKEKYCARVVERCAKASFRDPKQEPCGFCGNLLPTWKKLTVHLAKHMEQIALPIIPLVERHRGLHGIDSSRGFVQMPQSVNTTNGNMMMSANM